MPCVDIAGEPDIAHVVDSFYCRVRKDALLSPYFADIDWPSHLPTMTRFWSSVVFQTGTYRGRPFDAHVGLAGLTAAHFDRWLALFTQTVDSLHQGPVAERMKARATQIAGVFRVKLGCWSLG